MIMENAKKLVKNVGYVCDVVDVGSSVVNICRGKESVSQGLKKVVKKGVSFGVRKGVGKIVAGSILGTGAAPAIIGLVAVTAVEFAIDKVWKN